MKNFIFALLLATQAFAGFSPIGGGGGGGGGGSGITSINGNGTSAQIIQGDGVHITANSSGGTTTISQTGLAPTANPTFTGTIGTALADSVTVVTDGSGNLSTVSTTSTEVGYVHGVTSAIQTQLNALAPLASPTFTGTITAPNGLGTSTIVYTNSSHQLVGAPMPLNVAVGGSGLSSLTAYSVLAGGTTSTGSIQQVSGLGTSSQVLTSNGPGLLPTWQAAGGGGGGGGISGLTTNVYPVATSSTTIGNSLWKQGSNGELQYNNFTTFKGSATDPVINLNPAGNAAGAYTDSSGNLYLTDDGVVVQHFDTSQNVYLDGLNSTEAATLYLGPSSSYASIGSNGVVGGMIFATPGTGTIVFAVDAQASEPLKISGQTSPVAQGMAWTHAAWGWQTNQATSSTYNVAYNNVIVESTYSSTGAQTITLFDATKSILGSGGSSGGGGQVIIIKDMGGSAGTNHITVNAFSGQDIDGASSATISSNYGVLRLYITQPGTNWATW